MLHHVFGRRPGRRTLDVDFGIAVRDWQEFQDLKTALTKKAGFAPAANALQRLIYPSTPAVMVDLIPFGGIEGVDQSIAWPPDEDIVMKVAGFADALDSALLVQLESDLTIRVVCLPALMVLKLFAWMDRKYENTKDAADILTILREYGEAGNEDRLYGEHLNLMEAEGFDIERAGARLLGIDAARLTSVDTRTQLRRILESNQTVDQLINHILAASGRTDRQHVMHCEALARAFRDDFLSA